MMSRYSLKKILLNFMIIIIACDLFRLNILQKSDSGYLSIFLLVLNDIKLNNINFAYRLNSFHNIWMLHITLRDVILNIKCLI